MTFVRTFDYKVLDMLEVGVDNWVSMHEFKVRALHCLGNAKAYSTC